MTTSELIGVGLQLGDLLRAMKGIQGARWGEVAEPVRCEIRALMAASGESNPLAVAIPVAKAMARDGKTPFLLLAVAAEMAEECP